MEIYLDCELNGFCGDLISIALISEDGREFYEVLPCDNPTEWVKENVIPVLGKDPIQVAEVNHKLYAYLKQFADITIIADYPHDIEKFCGLICDTAGLCLNVYPLTFKLLDLSGIKSSKYAYKPDTQHNALADARASMLSCKSRINENP